jgi:hypothetical protein
MAKSQETSNKKEMEKKKSNVKKKENQRPLKENLLRT